MEPSYNFYPWLTKRLGAPPSRALAARWYYIALGLFIFTASFFSSNIQQTFPLASRLFRLGGCGLVALMVGVKLLFLQPLPKESLLRLVLLLVGCALMTAVSGDLWPLASALLATGTAGVDLGRALRVCLWVHLSGILLVLAFRAFGLIQFTYTNNRNFDWGFGHYNGFGGRLLGLYTAGMLLGASRWKKAVLLPGAIAALGFALWCRSRTTMVGLFLVLALTALFLFCPRLFKRPPVRGLLALLPTLCALFSCWVMVFYQKGHSFWELLNRVMVERPVQSHVKFADNGVRLLGGVPVEGEHWECVDNFFAALALNKGVLALLFVVGLFTLLLWQLPKKGSTLPALILGVMMIYGLMENRVLSLVYTPTLLWGGLLLFTAPELQPQDALSPQE